MPQAPRKDATSQRAQDKESKRARGALSCAECRRLKLKCDKTVPCSSCKRRGCSAICPNGSLITGQGTRFVLADTEKLHQKIAHMSDRIRQLEDALAILQSTVSKEAHPLLDRELLKIKSSIELHSAVEGEEHESPDHQEQAEESQYIDAFGTLAIRDDGAATFYGRSAGSESLLIGEATSPLELSLQRDPSGSLSWPAQPHSARSTSTTSPEISSLAASFPLPSSSYRSDIDLEYLVSTHLPPWPQAYRLCQLYLDQAPWFFGAVTQRQLHEEILPMWYNEAPKSPPELLSLSATHSPASSFSSPPMSSRTNSDTGVTTKGGAHDLALLFVIFCFGALTDMELPAAPDNVDAEQFYQLTKASLTLEPILERPPSVATVQTLSLMAIYEGLCSGENSIESTWTLMGLATKLAQSIGLHRDSARWKLSPAEVQKRRALFWELFITDCWQSLATGRLATFSLPFVDCELPSDPDRTMDDDGTPQPSFPFWKARFGAECVSAVVQGTLTSRAPKYSIILDLDRKVRDMELPSYAQGPPPQGLGLALTMSHFMPTNYRELTLLYIHRCFFAHAISSNPLDPIKSQYAPSFLAGYRSACTIIGSVKQQFAMFPEQIARFWVLWTHAFSATVMLASVVTHSSKCKVAPAALMELNSACELFASAANHGGRAVKFLPILRRLQGKAQQIYRETTSGIAPKIQNDIFRPSEPEDNKDELSIFSGKTHTVATKSANTASSSPTPLRLSTSRSPTQGGDTADSSRASSDSPKQAFTDNPSFANVHPSLVNELNVFDGQIRAQLQNAQRADLFSGSSMAVDRGPSLQQQQQRHQQELARQQQIQIEQRQEWQRFQQQQERERQEVERQQQVIMQQQAQQQAHLQQQQELLRQQQQLQQQQEELRRQEQLQQQQRQEQYRLQVEEQQRHLQQQQQQQHAAAQQQHYRHGAAYTQPSGPDHAMHDVPPPPPPPAIPTSVSTAHHLRQLSHSQSHPNLQLAYQQQQHYQPMPHAIPSRHPVEPAPPPPQQQHQMYAVPPGEFAHHHRSSPESSVASPVHYTPPTTSTTYDARPRASQSHYRGESYQYWPGAPSGYAMEEQQPYGAGPQQQQQAYQPHQHYTPGGVLRGIAAEDSSLQETWQSYMHKVASPRHLFED